MNICIQYTAWYHNTGVKKQTRHGQTRLGLPACNDADNRSGKSRFERWDRYLFIRSSDILDKRKEGEKRKRSFCPSTRKKVISTRELLIKIVVEDY